ncbi:mitochondrial import inner membrane translocase subunit Tim23-like [Ornithodoros turicata]|uniref:mitochondrial import inner membrane translocase subunit Tim23-like n=1 Tax=Ornithodoros turicata TaxID=34597 RepID=UPI003139EA81
MDRQGAGYFGAYPSIDPSFQIPSGQNAPVSPYLNFDPAFINAGGPEWIFPEGASRQRGRFELAFSQIGGSVMTGAAFGGITGFYRGLKETNLAGHTGSIRRTQMLNYITKGGAGSANILGVIAVMYSGFGVILSFARGADDELNTLAAGTLTGLLYKSTSGLRKCAIGGGVGLGLATLYCLYTGKDRLKQMLEMNPS